MTTRGRVKLSRLHLLKYFSYYTFPGTGTSPGIFILCCFMLNVQFFTHFLSSEDNNPIDFHSTDVAGKKHGHKDMRRNVFRKEKFFFRRTATLQTYNDLIEYDVSP